MLITLKPHSTFAKFFDEKEYKIEITSFVGVEINYKGNQENKSAANLY